MKEHIPVLMNEVLDSLNLTPGAAVLDGTVGLGGHASQILKVIGPKGQLVGIDRDARNLELAEQNLTSYKDQVTLIHDSFGDLAKHDLGPFDGILFDLGFSSVHVDDASRGFSFQADGPLDMRYDTTQEVSAETIVNGWQQNELADLFRVYGEEPRANQIAKAITHERRKDRIVSTKQLADLIESVAPRRGKIHPATKVFQALRMQVNDELGEIDRGLEAAVSLLKPEGRLCVITFHSLEDRLVKQFINNNQELTRVSKKPIRPSWEEQQSNPRSRSAKLRVAEKQGGYGSTIGTNKDKGT